MIAVSLTINVGHFSHLPHVGCTPSPSIGGTRTEEFAELHLHTHQLRHRHNFYGTLNLLCPFLFPLYTNCFPVLKWPKPTSSKIGDENDCAEVWYRDEFWVSSFAGCCNRPVLKTATHTCYLHQTVIMIKTNRSVAQIVHLPAKHKVPHNLYNSLKHTKCRTSCTSACKTQSAPQLVQQLEAHKVSHTCTSACRT
jgi:hypothetical protein